MAKPTLTYGGLNLNDGTTYDLLPGVVLGEKRKTWDEVRSYAGTVTQLNVTEANLIQMSFNLMLKGTSTTTLKAAKDAINTLIDAGAQTLVYNDGSGNQTFYCVHSERIDYTREQSDQNGFWAKVTFQPWRTP